MNFLKKHSKAVSFFGLLLLFWGQYLVFGITRSVDTVSFEIFSALVYPLYPAVLWIFRTLFGADRGYYLLGFFQNLLLVVSLVSLNDYIRKAFRLDGFTHGFLIVLSAMVFIAQKFLTRSGLISSNTLISEAVSIPFYLLFFRHALQAVLEQDLKAFRYSCVFATLIVLTRAQLYWVLSVVFLVRLYLSDGNGKRTLLSAVLVCAVIAGFVQGIRFVQNYTETDVQSKAPSNLYLLTTAVYCSEREDAALFPENSPEQRLFNLTRDWMEEPDRLAAFEYETGDFTNRHKKFEASYDNVKGILWYYYYELMAQDLLPDMSDMFVKLVLAHPDAFLIHCAQNGLTGLIRTVAILRPGINLLAGAFYAYLILCLLISRKNENLKKERQLTCLGLVGVLLNALIMAPGVFALSRYMFYNMLPMYFSAILFLRALMLEWKNRPRKEEAVCLTK